MNRRTASLLALLVLVAGAALALRQASNEPVPDENPRPFVRGVPPADVPDADGASVRLVPVRTVEASLVGLAVVPGHDAMVAIDQRGRLLWLQGEDEPRVWLDVSGAIATNGNEQGLLGLAFDPDFATSRRLYVNYTRTDGATNVSRWVAPPDGAPLDRDDEEVLLTVPQPYSNHNGGHLAFGPDGMLYIGLGDGGAGGDPQDYAERRQELLGSLLRVDVSGPRGYEVPPDNPYVGHARFKPEIYAFGLRNPWRFAFDTHDRLWIADVGQNAWEEVNVTTVAGARGAYFGWNTWEADQCFVDADCTEAGSRAVPEPAVMPVHAYSHAEGCSVSGGAWYEGSIAALSESYLFTDFCTGTIWALREGPGGWERETVLETELMIPAFTERDGELLVLDIRGTIYQLVSAD